ncbi:MAG TPA: GTP-binding protein, partial [Candidatus Aquilonibacter sp.]|nr:GTP-binding protein [Candidatus Aquilonibacter sp.]
IKNMISGASYAEIALLIVSAKKEEGIKDQTKRHIFIARMLGIEKLVVAVNKMDLIGYDKGKFEEITAELRRFIEKIGFTNKNVYFVPTSAYNGDNLIKKSANIKWYKGKTLVDLLYINAKIEDKSMINGPLRAIAQGFIDSEHETVVGKVISGKISVGSEVTLLPFGDKEKVTSIAVKGKNVKSATVNDDVAIRFGKPVNQNIRGAIIAGRNEKPIVTNLIESTIFVTGKIKGNLVVKVNGKEIKCKKLEILNHIDTTNGNITGEKKADELNAIGAKLTLETKIPVEKFAEVKELGRFVLYSDKKFAGIGVVL